MGKEEINWIEGKGFRYNMMDCPSIVFHFGVLTDVTVKGLIIVTVADLTNLMLCIVIIISK